MLFFKKNFLPRHLKNETPGQKRLRRASWVIIFAVVAIAFWVNGERRFKNIEARKKAEEQVVENTSAFVTDETGALSAQQLKALDSYARRFEERYGFRLSLVVADESPISEAQAAAFHFGLSPGKKEVFISVPPLLAKNLGNELLDDLREKHFRPYFESGDWQTGLVEALNKITDRLESDLEEQP